MVQILVLNAGSSSLKFAIYAAEGEGDPVCRVSGQVSDLGAAPTLTAQDHQTGARWRETMSLGSSEADDGGLGAALDWLKGRDGLEPDVIGHRIVHGGLDFTAPAVLDPQALSALQRLAPLAPLHQPANLAAVGAAARQWPRALQVGAFDTAFHATQPRLARLYAIPRDLTDDGVLGYGFHGLSYAYIAGRLVEAFGPEAGGRVIVGHLGSGVSLCALDRGRSVATTMGFSALEGPPMSTRSGSIDPGVLLYLLQTRGYDTESLSELLYRRSGLLGVSGESGDVRKLLASRSPAAREALELFAYRIGREVGGLAAALGGVDRMVFTAGVGENAPEVREAVAAHCRWLGLQLDPQANRAGTEQISRSDSRVQALVMRTDEQIIIARAAHDLWKAQEGQGRP